MTGDPHVERFFLQDLVTGKVTSFAIGSIWYYFYRETLIGIMDLNRENDPGFLMFLDPAQLPLPNDNYTSQHLLTADIIKGATGETGTPEYVSREVLTQTAMDWGRLAFARFDRGEHPKGWDKATLAEVLADERRMQRAKKK